MWPGVEEVGDDGRGAAVERIILQDGPLTVAVLTLGATVQDVRLEGFAHPLVLGAEYPSSYRGQARYFGAIVGRVANRIANGRAVLDGRELHLDRNEAGRTTLHGGSEGTSDRLWQLEGHDERSCRLTLELPDGDMGFPGRLQVAAEFRLADAALEIVLEAVCDRPTFCNLAHHGYWNLDDDHNIREHLLQVEAAHYLPVDEHLIPTGEQRPVDGTAFDFRQPRAIGESGQRYDHNFCLAEARRALQPAARLTSASNGLSLLLETTEPGLQVYDGAKIGLEPHYGLEGRQYGAHAGVALEPQCWPDAPNQPGFPDITLRPGETYRQVSRFSLSQT